jgi:hypothetical protein
MGKLFFYLTFLQRMKKQKYGTFRFIGKVFIKYLYY